MHKGQFKTHSLILKAGFEVYSFRLELEWLHTNKAGILNHPKNLQIVNDTQKFK